MLVEFWDVGGSQRYEVSRNVFYRDLDGLILVHDLTNRKSHGNLQHWLADVLGSDEQSVTDPESMAGHNRTVPALIVGTKADQCRLQEAVSSSLIADQLGAATLTLDCLDAKEFAAGSSKVQVLNTFLSKVLERKRGTARDGRRRIEGLY